MPIISAFGRLRQEDLDLEACLNYKGSSGFIAEKKKKREENTIRTYNVLSQKINCTMCLNCLIAIISILFHVSQKIYVT
jgi:hypothetical protein